MIGMTLCSGIGAPELAAPWVDWRFCSDIERFPRAVLKQRFEAKDVRGGQCAGNTLWPDFTALRVRHMRRLGIPLPDLIVAGTPCQDFSIAGLRAGTAGDRGNLTLQFVRTVHAIVNARPDGKLCVVWENVLGVLSDRGNAFGNFLGAIVGAMDAIPQPDGGSWPGEGMVEGPRSRAAWCVLDAQWFGLAQRRRRVFVVVDFGNCFDPAAILLEPDRLRGDTPTRGEAGQDVAGNAGSGASHWGGGPHPALNQSHNTGGIGASNQELFSKGGAGLVQGDWPAEVAPTLNAHFGDKQGLEDQHALNGAGLFVPDLAKCLDTGGRFDPETETLLAVAAAGDTTHALTAEGHDASEDGTGRGTPVVAFDCKGTEVQHDESGVAPPLRSMGHHESHQNAGGHAAVAFDMRGREDGAQFEGPHDTANMRAASGGSSRSYVIQGKKHACPSETNAHSILRSVREEIGTQAFAEWGLGILDTLQPAEILRQALYGSELRPAPFSRSWIVYCAVSREEDRSAGAVQSLWEAESLGRSPQGREFPEQLADELGAYLSRLSQPGTQAERFMCDMWDASQGIGFLREALSAIQEARLTSYREGQSAQPAPSVRRLTPEECEFLQGVPRGFTAITYRGKPAADGPRYKALGNSMAVPVLRWILDRVGASWEEHT
ncbi:MAG: DNA cytosine methyltransferase [Pikeienuella sp.]